MGEYFLLADLDTKEYVETGKLEWFKNNRVELSIFGWFISERPMHRLVFVGDQEHGGRLATWIKVIFKEVSENIAEKLRDKSIFFVTESEKKLIEEKIREIKEDEKKENAFLKTCSKEDLKEEIIAATQDAKAFIKETGLWQKPIT